MSDKPEAHEEIEWSGYDNSDPLSDMWQVLRAERVNTPAFLHPAINELELRFFGEILTDGLVVETEDNGDGTFTHRAS